MTIEEAIDIIETSTYLWLRTTDLERTALSMALEALADRKTEPTMRLHEWTSDDITFCTAKCEVKCFRKPKHIKHKDIPHSFSDFSNICVEYEPKDEPQTEQKWTCVRCGFENHADFMWCFKCGYHKPETEQTDCPWK